jgi:hypothetical protein
MSYSATPCLSPNLEQALSLLGDSPSDDELNHFLDRFGTHSIKRVDMGAKFVATATFGK